MTFQVFLPAGGVTGWRLLNQTKTAQMTALSSTQANRTLTSYFRENISKVKTPDDLLSDRRLLTVALGAFGLDDDISSRAFIRKVLAEGTLSDDAFANRLSDKRYLQLAKAFGFKDFATPRTQLSYFADEIVAGFQNARFESSVGEQDADMRMALTFANNIGDVLDGQQGERARWFAIMGNPPLRKVLEGAFGLPSSFGRLSLDQQLDGFKSGLQKLTRNSDVSRLSDPELQERLVRIFLIRQQVNSPAASPILGLFRV